MTEANAVLASVSLIPIKVIKILHSDYQIPDPLPWPAICRADRYSAPSQPLTLTCNIRRR